MAPRLRALWNVQVTVSPSTTVIADGSSPLSQLDDTRFQSAGTVSATS
jgi:hypothetical protein